MLFFLPPSVRVLEQEGEMAGLLSHSFEISLNLYRAVDNNNNTLN